MYTKTMSAAAATVSLSLVAIDGATAEGGCGPGFHRKEFGGCRPNGPVCARLALRLPERLSSRMSGIANGTAFAPVCVRLGEIEAADRREGAAKKFERDPAILIVIGRR
jgi:hypothetical protein